MEENKFDLNTFIGFMLIGAILLWMLYQNQPTEQELLAEAAAIEQVASETNQENTTAQNDSAKPIINEEATQEDLTEQTERLKNQFGDFAYAATQPSWTDQTTVLENDLLSLVISNKGGYIVSAELKNETQYQGAPVYLIRDGNSGLDLKFQAQNRLLSTAEMYFEPHLTKDGEDQVLSMKLKTSEQDYLEYIYRLPASDYMLGFDIVTRGLEEVIEFNQPIELNWSLKGFRQAKSISYENRYTRLTYAYDNGNEFDKLGPVGSDEASERDVTWINFRQHFFSSMLLTDSPFQEVGLYSDDLVKDETIDTTFTKAYRAKVQLTPKNNRLDQAMSLYFGPTDYKVFKSYDKNLDEAMPLGWGIFGWINKYVIFPVFGFLSQWFPAGIAIILLTVFFKLLLSPVQYKQYVSQAKLKVLKPEMDEIKKKFEGNQMKIQQETMKLQNTAGASPLKGCLPALLQIPVFYALFTFFPTAYVLRQKSFLWADDLSSYDVVLELPFSIPFYGDHVSLFPILASIAIFFYMMMSTGQQMQQQQQPGMPNMKFLMYLSPVFMLVFFNNYASGLSLYYFTSNVITIGIMLVIKNFIIDEDKIHAKIQETKKKPKKQNRFQKKMAEMMEQAEAQKKAQQKK
ncbi:MAG: membrane protein insertase YidC [Bacteroidetes bacterium]|nr:membrane protein insertase YidC [Bacteroidota bacterium]